VSISPSDAFDFDGRTQRSSATRRKILDATRKLLIAEAGTPTAEAIAAAAGIAKRTLFRHFDDLESLFGTLLQEAHANIAAVMDEPFNEDRHQADWQTLLDEVVERRVKVYEYLLPVYLSGIWWRNKNGQRTMLARRRRRLREVLPSELASDEVMFEALDATLSIEYWASLRNGQNLSISRARQVLRHAAQELTHSSLPKSARR
jgi:AcrR family transcriptional regulator